MTYDSRRPVQGFPEDGEDFQNADLGGDPFDVPDFYVTPRSPTNEPVMPNEVYYNKIMQDEDDLTTPDGSPQVL